jgi:hypothetical protein
VQIASPLPARGDVALFPGARLDAPTATPLFKAGAEPVRDVTWLPEHRAFRVVVEAGQPPGVYSGVILARDGDKPLGTLVVTLFAP